MPTVRVPQESGDIQLSSGGDAAVIYVVKNSTTEVAPGNLTAFLARVPGAAPVGTAPSLDMTDQGKPVTTSGGK